MENDYLKTIGARIRKIRKALDRKQTEQAAMLEIQANTWSQYENGISDFSVLRLIEIAESLGHPASAFLGGIPFEEELFAHGQEVRIVRRDGETGLSKTSRIAMRIGDIERLLAEIRKITVEGTHGEVDDQSTKTSEGIN